MSTGYEPTAWAAEPTASGLDTPIPICVIDTNMQVVSANGQLCELLGQDQSDLTGIDAREFQRRFFADRLDLIDGLYLGIDPSESKVEVRLQRGDGEPRWAQLRFRAAFNEHQRVERVTVYFFDITDLRSTEVRLTRRLELEDLLRSMASHLLEVRAGDEADALEYALGRIGRFFNIAAVCLCSTDTRNGQLVSDAFWSKNRRKIGPLDLLSGAADRMPLVPPVNRLFPNAETTAAIWSTRSHPQPLPFEIADFLKTTDASLIGVPIFTGGAASGLLVCLSAGERSWSKDEVDALRAAVGIFSQFSSRVTAETEVGRRLELEDALRKIAIEFLDVAPAEGMAAIASSLGTLGPAIRGTRMLLWSVDRANLVASLIDQWIAEDSVLSNDINPRIDLANVANPAQLLESETAVRIDVASFSAQLGFSPPWLAGNEVVLIPLRQAQKLFAVIVCVDGENHGWDESELSAMQSFANLVPAMRARLEAESQLSSAFDSAPVGITLRDEMGMLVACNEAYLRFLGRESEEVLLGTLQMEVLDIAMCDMDELEWAVRPGETQGVELPYKRSDGTTVWGRTSNVSINQGDNLLMLGHIEDITESRSHREKLQFQADHDELTGLANRRRLLQTLNQLMEHGRTPDCAGIMLIDLDRFKVTNDSLGHTAGDALLRQVADRFRLAVRPTDTVARFGGDEFVILLHGPVTTTDAAAVATRLLELLEEPFDLSGQTVFTSASIGIAFPDLSDQHNEDVLRHADAAMYEAKAKGRNRYEIFDQRHRELVMLRSATESDLRRAVGDQSLIVHYQPEFDLRTRRIIGAEALVRWPHAKRGVLSAADFVSIAEDCGLSSDLGSFVLREACQAAARWRDTFDLGDFQIRVNVSTKQIDRPDFVGMVSSALLEAELPPSALCLEITETAIMNDPDLSLIALAEIEALGVSLAIDDFGTGFSSLSYLKRFPVDALKIDKVFIDSIDEDLDNQAIVSTIIALANSMGLDTVAEGIESEEQLEVVVEMGCHRGQGFLLSQPVPERFLVSQLSLATLDF